MPLLSSAWDSLSLTQTPSRFGDQARVPQNLYLRDLTRVTWFFPPMSLSGCRRVQLVAEASSKVSIERRNRFSFLDVCCFCLFLMHMISLPGFRYCLQHPPRWNQTSGFSRPCTWSVLFPLPHPLPSSVSLCLLVFVEVPWHYNFKAVQRMEVISPTSWMNKERNQDEKGVLQSHPCFGDIDRKTTWKELSEVRCKDTRGNPLLTKTQTPHFLLKPP